MSRDLSIEDLADVVDDPLNRHSLASWKRDRDAELDAVRSTLTTGFDAVRAFAESLPKLDEDDDATTFFESGGFVREGLVQPALEFILEHARLEPDKDGNTNPLYARRRVRVPHGARFDDEIAAYRAFCSAVERGAKRTGATAQAIERYRLGIVDLSGGRVGVSEPIGDPHLEAVAEAVQAVEEELGAEDVRLLLLTYVEVESARDRYDGGGMRAGAQPAVSAARAVREWFAGDEKERRKEPCPMPAWARVQPSPEITASLLVADRAGLVVAPRGCSACGGSGRVGDATSSGTTSTVPTAHCVRCRGSGRIEKLLEGRELWEVEAAVRRRVKAARTMLRDLLRTYRLDVRLSRVIPEEEPKAPHELPTRADQEARAARGPHVGVECCVGFLVQDGVRVACRSTTVRGPKLLHPSVAWPRCDACGCPVVPQRRAASSDDP